MPKVRWWWFLLAIPIVVWGGFDMLSFNHAQKIADAVMYEANGDLNEIAFGAALASKFPGGTTEEELAQFIAKLGGTCFEAPAKPAAYCGGSPEARPPICAMQLNATLYCKLPISGTVCAVSRLEIEARIGPAHQVSNIFSSKRSVTC